MSDEGATIDGHGGLRSTLFRREREPMWRELDELLTRVERRGIDALEPKELVRLPALYRATVSSLSVARSISLDRNVLDFLGNLARRGYFAVYAPRLRIGEAIIAFLLVGFPAAVRAARWHILLAGLFIGIGMAAGWLAVARDAELFYAVIPESVAQSRGPASSTESLRAILYTAHDSASGLQVFASFLFTHNSQIAIMAFALSFALGVPTALLLFYNGTILGAFGALYHGRGLGFDFWGWVLPHGVTEIGAIVLCGGAGLVIADSLIFPGAESRLDRLAKRGRLAGQVVIGGIVMLFVAALIEGFFRQLVLDPAARYAVAAATAAFWAVYFTRAGRGEAP